MSFVVILPQKRKVTSLDAFLYLTPRERDVLACFKNVYRAHMWFLERLATKKAIKIYLEKTKGVYIPWNIIDIIHDEKGIPHFKIVKRRFGQYEKNTSISLNYIKNIAIGGIANKNIEGSFGVILEKIRNFKLNFLKAFLNKKEIEEITKYKTQIKRKEMATILWSIKEAYLKSLGEKTSPKEIFVKKIRQGLYEIYNKQNLSTAVGFAKSWFPQTDFVAIEVYAKT